MRPSIRESPFKIPKYDFRNYLIIAGKETFFTFNNQCYKQIDGVAMRYPLGPGLLNTFMCSFENNCLRDCPIDFKNVFYRRYVEDMFSLF